MENAKDPGAGEPLTAKKILDSVMPDKAWWHGLEKMFHYAESLESEITRLRGELGEAKELIRKIAWEPWGEAHVSNQEFLRLIEIAAKQYLADHPPTGLGKEAEG